MGTNLMITCISLTGNCLPINYFDVPDSLLYECMTDEVLTVYFNFVVHKYPHLDVTP